MLIACARTSAWHTHVQGSRRSPRARLPPSPDPPPPSAAPFTYSVAGKRLALKEANGQLFVRTGGGYEELVSVLAKLPAAPAGAGGAGPGSHALPGGGAGSSAGVA